jgi:NAD(P)-dependent dehydrogenase (short-subunit alcohol dehydrogenase family)
VTLRDRCPGARIADSVSAVRRVEGKVAIVTGAGSGIGEATASVLAAEGASVVVDDIRGAEAQRVAKSITDQGGRALAVDADVSDEPQVAVMVETAVREFGRLDVLDNNAALTEPTQFARDRAVADMTLDTWERVLATNLRGVMLGCKHAIPAMIDNGGGSIVNVSSGAAKLGDFHLSAYAASKAGIHALTRSVAVQYGRDGIRANTVVPGLILTPAAETNLTSEKRALLASNVLLPYLGRPVDVAHLVLFLASDEARYLTAQEFVINGGQTAHQPTYAQELEARARQAGG